MLIKNKKAGVPLAITLLVVATILLCIIVLFYMVSKEKQGLGFSSFSVSDIYENENKINYYIQEIVDKASIGVSSEEEFISSAVLEIEKYRNKEKYTTNEEGSYFVEELMQVKSQLIPENIEIVNGKVMASFEIIIKSEIQNNNELKDSAEYNYKKTFINR